MKILYVVIATSAMIFSVNAFSRGDVEKSQAPNQPTRTYGSAKPSDVQGEKRQTDRAIDSPTEKGGNVNKGTGNQPMEYSVCDVQPTLCGDRVQ